MPRTTIVTHPDGTTSKRNSMNRIYTHAVERSEDIAKHAMILRARIDRIQDWHAAATALIAAGDLTKLILKRRSYSVAGGWNYNAYVPGFEQEGDPALPDYRDAEKWNRYRDQYLNVDETVDRIRKALAKLEAEIAAGRTHRYGVTAWCSRRDLAEKAARSGKYRPAYATDRAVPCQEA